MICRIRTKVLLAVSILLLIQVNTVSSQVHQTELSVNKRIAIVIDDFGNDMVGTKEMMELPFPITVAVMPFLPTTQRDAEWANRVGFEVLVHLPMEPAKGNKAWLGPGAITTDLPDQEIRKRVLAAIDNVPHAAGINNHMGSKATIDERVMRIVLQVWREKGIFFLDSHTNYFSIVKKLAREIGVPCIENELFLDDIVSKRHIEKQMNVLQQKMKEKDHCVVIGHVGDSGKQTAVVLGKIVPGLMKEFKFVPVSHLLYDNFLDNSF